MWNVVGNLTRPVGTALALCVVCTQFLAVYKLKGRYYDVKARESSLVTGVVQPSPIDDFLFDRDVARPHKAMVERFEDHPDQVISKLREEVGREEARAVAFTEELSGVKRSLGMNATDEALLECPRAPPALLGQILVLRSFKELDPRSPGFRHWYGADLEAGGRYRPRDCRPRQRLAVVVPYRDRADNLRVFLHHMHPVLQRQKLDYRVFVVEQEPGEGFNRASLLNAGFAEANKLGKFDCFALHDVDLLPEDDRNAYLCPEGNKVKHMNVAVDKWNYKLQYANYVGGVSLVPSHVFRRINGLSNAFYGWGGEDDDFRHRLFVHNVTVVRSSGGIGKFSMSKHDLSKSNEDLANLMAKSENRELDHDGLATLNYTVVDREERPLYTYLRVRLPRGPENSKAADSWWDAASSKLEKAANHLGQGVVDSVLQAASDAKVASDGKIY